jgi:hypothetical protein
MSEKYQFYPDPPLPPLIRGGGKLIKVPLFKGDLGGSTSVLCNTKKFSDILLVCPTLASSLSEKFAQMKTLLATSPLQGGGD